MIFLQLTLFCFARKLFHIKESTKLLEILNQEKKILESKQEELENLKSKELEEKLANVRRLYGEMKNHLVIR